MKRIEQMKNVSTTNISTTEVVNIDTRPGQDSSSGPSGFVLKPPVQKPQFAKWEQPMSLNPESTNVPSSV